MRRLFTLAVLLGSGLPVTAFSYEYTLQFTPNYGARNLVVAGYSIAANTVSGNCSYITVTGGGGGRGGGGHGTTTYYNQACTWDLVGNLLSITPGTPIAPAPLSTAGGLTIYAREASGEVTGVDVAHGNIGFVETRRAQYVWVTPSGGYVFARNQKPFDITLTLQSVGDLPLLIGKFEPLPLLAKATVMSTNCARTGVSPGKTCLVVVAYDARGLPGGDNPYTAYDTLTVGIVSNAGVAPDFTESIEVPVAPAG